MYIRSYLTHYWPTQNQTFADLDANLKLKYDSESAVFCPVLTNSTSTDNCLQQAKDQCRNAIDAVGCFSDLLQQAMKISSQRIKGATQLLRKYFPNAGTYVNHIAYDEPDVFNLKWGEKLQGLMALKKKYDPENLLTCHQCLSEVEFDGSTADDSSYGSSTTFAPSTTGGSVDSSTIHESSTTDAPSTTDGSSTSDERSSSTKNDEPTHYLLI
jgi:hypothetical protein